MKVTIEGKVGEDFPEEVFERNKKKFIEKTIETLRRRLQLRGIDEVVVIAKCDDDVLQWTHIGKTPA